ncbi:MAG: glutathione S-transferase family protein [Proteobacteria bacterium]|nr:glutathione S-transferase family protein [Pseudomonadota bacterium]
MSAKPVLVVGSKNYSSWSLRPWLLLRQFGVAFDEIMLPLDTPEFYARIHDYSPTGRVPVLHDGDIRVWDSLAIAEYVNERWLGGRGWPRDHAARAFARSVSAEMHSGFPALRSELPMNCRKRVKDHPASKDAQADIERIKAIWREARERYGKSGPFLFGTFGIADAMYAPVVLRFESYDVALDPDERAYSEAILALPALQEWLAATVDEPLAPLHEQAK